MQLSEMHTRTQIYLDDRQGDRWTDPELTGLLNASQEEIQKVIDGADEGYFSGCQTYSVEACTTSFEFDLPDNFKKVVLGERIMDAYDPVPVQWVTFQDRHLATNAEEPVCYIRGDKLGVVEPSSSYTLRLWYTKKIPDLATDADVSEIPRAYHNLVCLYAARLGLSAEGRMLPDGLEREFADEMTRLTFHIESRQRQTPRSVRYIED